MRSKEFIIRLVEVAGVVVAGRVAWDLLTTPQGQQLPPEQPVAASCPPHEGCVLSIDKVQEQLAESAAREDAITDQIVGPFQVLFDRANGVDSALAGSTTP